MEMNKEKLRQEHNRELEEKEQEVEDMRASSQKRVSLLSETAISLQAVSAQCVIRNEHLQTQEFLIDNCLCRSKHWRHNWKKSMLTSKLSQERKEKWKEN